jgi:hypothetical protein
MMSARFLLRLEDGLVHFSDSFDDLALRMFAVSTPLEQIDAHSLDKIILASTTPTPDLGLLKSKNCKIKLINFYNNQR